MHFAAVQFYQKCRAHAVWNLTVNSELWRQNQLGNYDTMKQKKNKRDFLLFYVIHVHFIEKGTWRTAIALLFSNYH